MALTLVYQNMPQKQVFDTIVVAHFDSHGVATAAARALLLQKQGQRVAVFSKFPETGPTPQFPSFVDQLRSKVEAKTAEVIDIPVNVKAPDLHIDAEARLPAVSIFHYDHHETSIPFAQRLAAKGITPVMVSNAVQMAAALGLLGDEESKKLAIVGIVADRDPSVISIVGREEIEQLYLPLANKLDVIVRNPQIVNASDQGQVAQMLTLSMLEQVHVEYPPYSEVNKVQVIETGDVAVLADFEDVAPQWAPKTAEELLRRLGKHYVVLVVPALDPRTRQQVGYDVRVLQYWLSEVKPTPEEVVKDIAARMAGNVVGHDKYVSLRLTGATKDQAVQLARQIFQRLEGAQPSAVHLVSDTIVAEAIRRDYGKIYELLERIAKALERGAAAKERQVELIEQDIERRRYD